MFKLNTSHPTDFSGVDSYGNTLLHVFSRAGYAAALRLVLRSGTVDPNQTNKQGRWPLLCAGSLDCCLELLPFTNPAGLRSSDPRNRNLLMRLVSFQHFEQSLFDSLVANAVDDVVNFTGSDYEGLLSLSAAWVQTNLATFLPFYAWLKPQLKPSLASNTFLSRIITPIPLEIIRDMLEAGANPTSPLNFLCVSGFRSGQEEFALRYIDLLLEFKADPFWGSRFCPSAFQLCDSEVIMLRIVQTNVSKFGLYPQFFAALLVRWPLEVSLAAWPWDGPEIREMDPAKLPTELAQAVLNVYTLETYQQFRPDISVALKKELLLLIPDQHLALGLLDLLPTTQLCDRLLETITEQDNPQRVSVLLAAASRRDVYARVNPALHQAQSTINQALGLLARTEVQFALPLLPTKLLSPLLSLWLGWALASRLPLTHPFAYLLLNDTWFASQLAPEVQLSFTQAKLSNPTRLTIQS